MRLVIDTNEFVAAFGPSKISSCATLLNLLLEPSCNHSLHLPRTIIDEIRRNLSPRTFSALIKILHLKASVDEDIFVPFELGSKYEEMGLKSADAFIAAYTEWVNAHALISENRHFLTRQTELPFQVMTAQAFLDHHMRRPRQR